MTGNINKETTNVSLQQLCQYVNNVNLDNEILVVEGYNFGQNQYDKVYFPIRLDALLIVLCREGESTIRIDLNDYKIKKDTLVVIQPKNYINLIDTEKDIKVDIVICSRHILENIMPKLTDVLPLLVQHRTEPVSYLTATEAEGLRSFHNFLRLKLQDPPTPFLKHKVICMLQAALYEMMDIASRNKQAVNLKGNRKKEIMANFILSVSEHFREERQISFYANKLCITPKHLSAVVKEISGRTASEWIESYVTMEAKILLRSTDMTIQEISGKLNFSNQSFFGKYFKHQTGMSPSDFRRATNPDFPDAENESTAP